MTEPTDFVGRVRRVARLAERHVSARADEIFACLVVATIVVASFWRLKFGVDFTDEAFYAAITQRYALGDLPYVDEYNLRQTASLLTVPPYWLYLEIRGSTDGVVYFLRALYFAVQIGTGWTIYRFAAKRIPRSFALIAASLPVVFIPFGIPTCSYNNLGAMLFAAGAFTGLSALLDDPRPRLYLAAGAIHGLACVAYPPLALPVLLFAAMTRLAPVAPWRAAEGAPGPDAPDDTRASEAHLDDAGALATPDDDDAGDDDADDDDAYEESDEEIAWRRARWTALRRYMLGLCVVGVLLGVLLLPGLLRHGVADALNYERMTTRVRSLDKARDVLQSALVTFVPGGGGWFASLGVIGIAAKQYARLRPFALAAVVLWIAYYFQDTQAAYPASVNSVYLGIYLGLLAGFFLLLVDWQRSGRVLALVGWVPSVVAGFITGFATANVGCVNGGMGLFTAACLAMIAAPMAARVAAMPSIGRLLGVLVMSAIPLGTLSVNLKTTYRSGDIATLTEVVRTGPYAGIWSAPSQVQSAEELTREVRAALGPARRMLSYYDFPAPYLSAPVKPAMPTVWTDSRANLSLLLPYYKEHRTGEGIVVVVNGMGNFCPPLQALVERPDRLIAQTTWFRVYREPPP